MYVTTFLWMAMGPEEDEIQSHKGDTLHSM